MRPFGGLRASHGVSVSHRSHGSTGQRQDPGKVFKQSIDAGKQVTEGTQVAFTVALAPSETTVPKVVGMTEDDARDALKKANLGYDSSVAYSDKVEKGVIISQSVAAGSKVKEGTTITVTVSLGAKPVENVEVPNVVSFSWSDAEAALHSAGLAARYTGDPAGVVVSQDIAAGTKVAPDTLVTVTLSTPTPQVEVPDLVGMTVSAAEKATDAVNLGLSVEGDPNGVVTEQWPEAGTQVDERTVVTVKAQGQSVTWTDAADGAAAAKGAGLSGFSVLDDYKLGNGDYNNPTFSYSDGTARAIYDAPASMLYICKASPSSSVPVTERKLDDFPATWTQNIKGLEVTCYGPDQDKATFITWKIDDATYGATFQGLGGEEMSMTPDEVQSVVSGIQ